MENKDKSERVKQIFVGDASGGKVPALGVESSRRGLGEII